MKRSRFKLFILSGLLAVLTISCKQEILDFFEAIKDYGYRSTQPLGPKKVPVNDALLGGYVYDGLPVIISKKDETTYVIEFLSILLNRESKLIEAHATILAGSTFLNLAMGDYYCFMRTNLILNEELQIDLLKDALKEYVPQEKLKGWLEAHPGEELYPYKDTYGENYNLEIYYSFIFTRITIDEARSIQKERLRNARMDLFENCSSYEEYEELVSAYPNDEFENLAVISLFNRCETIEEFKQFMAYFPQSDLVAEAKLQIEYIIENERLAEFLALDKKNYDQTKSINTIDAYEQFLTKAQTKIYRDSAAIQISFLAQKITKDDVEWKWTNGEDVKALQLMYYKIDFMKGTEGIDWVIDLLTLYTLKHNDKAQTRISLEYLDKIAKKNIVGDDFLNLYLCKGFILWSLSEFELCIKVFELKLGDTFSKGETFKEVIKQKYESYIGQGIAFPEQSATWKRIKKLKLQD